MRSAAQQLAFLLTQVKIGVLVSVPFAAYAAEQALLRKDSISALTIWTWLFLIIFSSVGWAIVHLDTLAEWIASSEQLTPEQRRGLWKSRLGIIKYYLASTSAGVAFYLLAKSVPEWVGLNFHLPEMVIFVGVVPAAMGGTVTWDWIGSRFRRG